MSEDDRRRWNERHAAAPAQDPDPWVLEQLPLLRALPPEVPRTALDVACGAGRHALLLAREGFDVTAVDVSDVGLARLRERAAAEGLAVRTERLDLDEGRLPDGPFGVILVILFLDERLWPALLSALAPGGLLVYRFLPTGRWSPKGRLPPFISPHADRGVFRSRKTPVIGS